MIESNRSDPDQRARALLLEWQQPIYNLAYRFLGTDADAADATQDIFIRVFEKWDRYDPSRPVRPWLYQVAINVLRNTVRRRSAQTRLERASRDRRLESSGLEEGVDRLEKHELESVVEEHLRDLPEDARLLLVLHFYNDISQVELAEILGLPRTTVQSRMRKALTQLQSGLGRSGHAALVPAAESVMRNSAALTVPESLSASLAALPLPTGVVATATGAGVLTGGVIMAKPIVTMVAVVALFSLGIGFFAGRGTAPAAESAPVTTDSGEDATQMVSWVDHQKIVKESEETRLALTALQLEFERVETERKALEFRIAAGSTHASADGSATELAAVSGSGVDWSEFRRLLGQHIDLVANALEAEEGRQPTAEEEKAMMEIFTQYMKVASDAKGISETPFFDADIFPEYVESLYGDTLGLSENQLRELNEACRDVLGRETAHFDPATGLPVESFRARERMIEQLDAALHRIADPEQRRRFEKMASFSRQMLEGNRDIVEMGLAPSGSRSDYRDRVLRGWQRAFSLEASQRPGLAPAADRFLDGAERILRDYGQWGEERTALDSASERAMRDEMLRLQIEVERSFVGSLNPHQVQALASRIPIAIRFYGGEGTQNQRRNGPGF